jgi:ABC-type glutathione transport system ATPase component
MRDAVVALESVGVTFATGPVWARRSLHALRDVTLAIGAGETLGVVGESGSGKTTLGRLLLGLQPPTTGVASFLGEPVPAARAARRALLAGRMSVVLQQPEWALNPRLRLGLSVAEPLAISGAVPRREREDRTRDMLALVGLDPDVAGRFPHELSGGQRQRVAIARALITEPRFIVFDEAVSALDVSVQVQILNLIGELQLRQGFAALFISHDLAATRYLCNRIAVMRAGEVVEVGDAARFYARPHHPYSQSLWAAAA